MKWLIFILLFLLELEDGRKVLGSEDDCTKSSIPSCVNGNVEMVDGECKCVCESDFTGDDCDIKNMCSENPCHHGGECRVGPDGDYYCDCKYGYITTNCMDRDPCLLEDSHCLNGATCNRINDLDFTCACAIPYQGDHCETLNLCNLDQGECLDISPNGSVSPLCYPCSENVEHENGCVLDEAKGNYECKCLPGFTGDLCEARVSKTSLLSRITLPVLKLEEMWPHNFIVHRLWIPYEKSKPLQPLMVALNVTGEYRIHLSIRQKYRPNCEDVTNQWEQILPTGSMSDRNMWFEDVSDDQERGDIYRQIPYNMTYPVESTDKKELFPTVDFYMIFWPEATDLSLGNRPVEVTFDYGIYVMNCTPKDSLNASDLVPDEDNYPDCFAKPSKQVKEESAYKFFLICECHGAPFDEIFPYLTPVEFQVEIYQPLELFKNSTFQSCRIIPWVVLTCTLLYLLFLIIFIFSDCWKNRRPKLIVMTDIKKIAIETFYLLTVETGRGLCASSSASISAQIYGTCYRTKPLVLSDHNVITTRQDDEDNFLFSTEKDLGDIILIRLWHDNQGYSPNWYCRKVILKNIKSGQTWYFYVSEWLSVAYSTLVLSVQVATPEQVERHRRGKFCKVLKYQFYDRHLVFSPFLCTSRSVYKRTERWTVLFTMIFIYMLLLIYFYGFPRGQDPEIILFYDNFAIFRPFVFLHGLYVVLIGLPILLLLDIIFRIWKRIRIPTLLVCGTGKSHEKPKRPPPPRNWDYNRWNNLDPNRIMVVGVPKEPNIISTVAESEDEWAFMTDTETEEPPAEDSLSTENFQVPSTSISRTENWIGSYLTKTDFPVPVQKIQQPSEKPPYHKILKDGVVGAVTSIKDADPNRLVYKDKEEDDPDQKHVDEKIAREIRDSFSEPYWKWPNVESSPRGSKDITQKPGGRKVVRIKDEKPQKLPVEPTAKPQVIDQGSQTTFAYEDPIEFAKKKEMEALNPKEKSSEIFYPAVELCETEETLKHGRCRPWWLFFVFLVLCLLIMVTCGIVAVFYGLRYGFYMSVNWCFSFLWALIFSFGAIEVIRIFIISIVLFCIRKRKANIESFDEIKAERRFRLIWFREGPCDFPPKWPLKYILFFPTRVFMPLSSYRMFWLRTEARKRSRLCRNLIDITLFLIFIIGIIILSVYIRSVEYFNSNHNIGEIFKVHVHEKNMENSFWGINGTEAFYGYLSKTFLSQIQEGNTSMTQLNIWNHGYTHPTSGFQWLTNEVAILLGPVRLRQHRVKEYPCEATLIPQMLNHSISCQREYFNTLLKKTYDDGDYYFGWRISPTNKTEKFLELDNFKIRPRTTPQYLQLAFENAWSYCSSYDTGSVSYHGFYSYYDGGGYTVLLNRNITISLELLKILQKEQWVDLRTRVIFIEFTTFNPNVDLYDVHVYAVERSGFSSWNMSTRTYTTRFPFVNEYGTSWNSGTLILMFIVAIIMILCIIYFFITSIYNIINTCRLYGCRGLKHSWLWIDLVIVLLSITCILIYIFSYLEAASKISAVAPDTKIFVNFQYAARLRQTYLHMLCVLLVICYVKFWRLFILSNRRTYVVGFTLTITRRLVFGSVLYFAILLCAFASFYRLVFGLFDHQFTSFIQSVTSLIQVAKVGSAMSFRALSEYDEFFGPVFYVLYNAITYFLMINVIISVLTMGLQEAQDSARHRSFKHDYVYFIWSNMKKLVPRRFLKRRGFSTGTNEWEHIKDMRGIDPQRLYQMKFIIQQTLQSKLEADDKVQKMREIKEFCNTDILPMYSQRTRIISKGEKFRAYKKHHMKIPQDRLETMTALTRDFLKMKTGHDFSVSDFKTYHQFNLQVTQLKFETLGWKINTLGHLLGQITQSPEFEGSEWELSKKTTKKDHKNHNDDNNKDETNSNVNHQENDDNNNESMENSHNVV